jgi:hypothetical protein
MVGEVEDERDADRRVAAGTEGDGGFAPGERLDATPAGPEQACAEGHHVELQPEAAALSGRRVADVLDAEDDLRRGRRRGARRTGGERGDGGERREDRKELAGLEVSSRVSEASAASR